MVITRGSGRPPLALLGAGAVLSVAIAAVVTVATARDNASGDDHAARSGTTSGSAPALASAVPGGTATVFGNPETDMFGRRVDVPVAAAGVALQQDPNQRQQPGTPGWTAAAPPPSNGEGVWQRIFGGPVVRFSASDGPSRIDGSAAVGFAHTPQGAALAAEQIYWRTNANPKDRDLLVRLVEVTPRYLADYDRLVAEGKVSDRLPDKLRPLLFASDAFRIESYADDFAKVQFARKARETVDGQPTWVGMRLAVMWRDGDWKLTTVTGDERVQIESLRSIEGWTQW
ncbi:hypothetical protein IU459_07680 [Nocardia amamiensis]|uniref:DUF8175 domain-containing protein n=1 Tax=Nocardia amamiensis TaxID=404578 RepID=A0ABS0CMJ9_9NOCA|nr:hypothetical protein [Nocardia amamiensis]MBF6297425.1 hypothetical protein [Nocardia amamiensis]